MNEELTLDVETGRFEDRNNAYSRNGELVSIHAYNGEQASSYRPDDRDAVKRHIEDASLLIFFNGKFDLAFLRKEGCLPDKLPQVWDVQLAHFLLARQSTRMPSLDSVLEYHGLPLKIDVVKTEYWDKNIETRDRPWPILCEYGEGDVIRTYDVYKIQLELFKQRPNLFKLFQLQCQDLVVLHEMEWNGLKYNSEKCKEKSSELQLAIDTIVRELSSLYAGIPLNFNSNQQLSAYLYGGVIRETKRELVGFYKTGQKIGEPRYKLVEVEHQLPRLVQPLKGTEMQAEGVFATDEATLKKLKGAKEQVSLLLKLAKLSKLKETYYEGMNKLNEEMNWPKDELHPTYHQVVAATGRLSSAKPNGQNMSGEFLQMLETRF